MYKSFVSLGRYTPKYCILFVAMVNGIVSLISLSTQTLLKYNIPPRIPENDIDVPSCLRDFAFMGQKRDLLSPRLLAEGVAANLRDLIRREMITMERVL